MCGRCACTLDPNTLQKACSYYDNAWLLPEWQQSNLTYKPFFNGGPTTVLPTISTRDNFPNSNTRNVLVPMRWSLATDWTSENYHTHNARIETLLTSNLYRPCVEKGLACVVVVDGFYEWKKVGTKKLPHLFYKCDPNSVKEEVWDGAEGWKGRDLLKMAGIFNYSEKYGYCCSVITTEACEGLKWAHDRMPLILNSDDSVGVWLDKESLKKDCVKDTLETLVEECKESSLLYHAVDPGFVNKVGVNEAKCIQEFKNVKTTKQPTLDNWFKKK